MLCEIVAVGVQMVYRHPARGLAVGAAMDKQNVVAPRVQPLNDSPT